MFTPRLTWLERKRDAFGAHCFLWGRLYCIMFWALMAGVIVINIIDYLK